MRNRFDLALQELDEMIIKMGMQVEIGMEKATSLIIEKNEGVAKDVYKIEDEVDKLEGEIQNHCLRLLIEQQPVARDLRKISAALKIITDMERIGDQAKDITDICMGYDEEIEIKATRHLSEMAGYTLQIIKNSVNAFVGNDYELASRINSDDDIVDEYFIKIRHDLIELIKQDEASASFILDLLMISRHLERAADHSVNIANWVMFVIEG